MWCKRGLLSGLLLAGLCQPVAAAVECDGIDDLLTQALSLDTFVNASTFTIAALVVGSGSVFSGTDCWNEGPLVTDANGILALGRSGTTGTGDACVSVWDGNNRNLTSPIWSGYFHLGARLSAGTLTLFVAGYPAATMASGVLEDVSGAFQFCGGLDGHSPDRLIEVAVYDTALSDAVIERMVLGRLSYALPGSPTAYYPLDDCPEWASGAGLPLRDRSGNNRHLTGAVGANGTGLTCYANGFLSQPWGIQ